jgi:hypothetical protein
MTTTSTRLRGALRITIVGVALALAATACEPNMPVPPPTTPAPAVPPTTPPTTTPAPPTTTKVTCPTGGSITVNTQIGASVRNLLAAAKADKVNLCGSGYRDQTRQIELRKQNCGTTYYDIWQKPSSQCTPPTAIPGTSMHEKGLAIDFTNCSTRTTACFTWLAANAAEFGLKNLPSEPWHWSTNGRSKDGHDHDGHDV